MGLPSLISIPTLSTPPFSTGSEPLGLKDVFYIEVYMNKSLCNWCSDTNITHWFSSLYLSTLPLPPTHLQPTPSAVLPQGSTPSVESIPEGHLILVTAVGSFNVLLLGPSRSTPAANSLPCWKPHTLLLFLGPRALKHIFLFFFSRILQSCKCTHSLCFQTPSVDPKFLTLSSPPLSGRSTLLATF